MARSREITPPLRTSEARAGGGVINALFGIDFRALGVFRICLGFLVFCDFIGRFSERTALYTEWGILPRLALIERNGDYWGYLSPYMWTGFFPLQTEQFLVGTLLILSLVCAFLLMVGWKTRPMTILMWALLTAVQNRNPLILHGADEVTRAFLFWGMFLPLGNRFSLDANQAKRTAYGIPTPQKALTLGTAGLLLQIGIIYWFTAALKNGAEWRQNGLAVYYALSIEQYATPIGQFMRQFHPLLKVMTFAGIGWEFLGPTLAFVPFATEKIRAFVAPMFMVFHLVLLNVLFDLGPFPYVAGLAWVVFVPPFVWDALAKKWVKSAAVNPALRPVEQLRETLAAWQTRRVAAYCTRQKPVPQHHLHLAHQMLAAFFITFIFLWNLRGMNYALWVKVLPAQADVITKVTRIDQGWGLFAPRPMTDDGWYVMPATLRNGEIVDVWTGKPVTWEKPTGGISGMYPNERWRKYLMNLWSRSNFQQRYYYGRYQCREWNRDHDALHQMTRFSMYYMLKETQPDYSSKIPTAVVMYDAPCEDEDASGLFVPSR